MLYLSLRAAAFATSTFCASSPDPSVRQRRSVDLLISLPARKVASQGPIPNQLPMDWLMHGSWQWQSLGLNIEKPPFNTKSKRVASLTSSPRRIFRLLNHHLTKVLCQTSGRSLISWKAFGNKKISDIINPACCRPSNPKLIRCGTNSATR